MTNHTAHMQAILNKHSSVVNEISKYPVKC